MSTSVPSPRDFLGRPLRDLRISVTDRCNYRCLYCMPLAEYAWLERDEILRFEEIHRLARIFVALGVEKIRLTGGEPLLRRGLERLVGLLASIDGLEDLSLTTNGVGLAARAAGLKAAGLGRITISLDSLRPERFRAITQRGDLADVLAGIRAARAAGLDPVKLNAVVLRGVNDDEVGDLVEFARANGCRMRFIEYMDVGNANAWTPEQTVSRREILERLRERFGGVEELGRDGGRAPAVDYRVFEGGVAGGGAVEGGAVEGGVLEGGAAAPVEVGIVGSVTEPFCSSCTRARLTADGNLVTCLFAADGHDLKAALRGGADDEEIARAIRSVWEGRRDRYSAERLETLQAGAYRAGEHAKIEMIRLGG
jgi:cyclic pyranopterin phosphate synthase